MPAPPPAATIYQHVLMRNLHDLFVPMRFVAAEAGFLPPGPFTFFADMMGNGNWLTMSSRVWRTQRPDAKKREEGDTERKNKH